MKKQQMIRAGAFALAVGFGLAGCSHGGTPSKADSVAGSAPRLLKLDLENPPLIGTTPAGQRIYLGGFSGLRYLGAAEGKLRFLTLTDRGPNTDEFEEGGVTYRPFLLPGYQPRLMFLEADPVAGTLKLERQVLLTKANGQPFSGIPRVKGSGSESPIDSTGKPVALDPQGGDNEGVAIAADGSFWVCEEYGPSLMHFSAEGKLLQILKPGNGLPKVLETRRLNRGFEGIAISGNRAYVAVQSPLDNPPSEGEKSSKKSRIVRIIEVDLEEGRTAAQYAYVIASKKTDKIGDLAVESPGVLLVVERDGKSGPDASKKVYRVRLEGATNLQLLADRVVGMGGSLERTKPEDLAGAGIKPVAKEEVVNLAALGLQVEKVEGIDVAGDFLAFVTDNDFGLNGELNRKNGEAGFKDEQPSLYLVPKGFWKK